MTPSHQLWRVTSLIFFYLSWLETSSQVCPLPLFSTSTAGNEVARPYLQLNDDFYLLFRVLSWFHWYHFYLGRKKDVVILLV